MIHVDVSPVLTRSAAITFQHTVSSATLDVNVRFARIRRITSDRDIRGFAAFDLGSRGTT